MCKGYVRNRMLRIKLPGTRKRGRMRRFMDEELQISIHISMAAQVEPCAAKHCGSKGTISQQLPTHRIRILNLSYSSTARTIINELTEC